MLRILSRRFQATFQRTPGMLNTPPRHVDFMSVKPQSVLAFFSFSAVLSFFASIQQMGIVKQDIANETYLGIKYSKLEDHDSVLRAKLMAARIAANEDEEDDE